MMNVAINGLGRIGRATLKILVDSSDMRVKAVNDLVPAGNLAYLLKYDSVYGRYDKSLEHTEEMLTVGGQTCRVLKEKDPAKLPWKGMGIDLVFECTGIFTTKEDLAKHVKAGAKHVILSAPGYILREDRGRGCGRRCLRRCRRAQQSGR